jgi:hypothetical protein
MNNKGFLHFARCRICSGKLKLSRWRALGYKKLIHVFPAKVIVEANKSVGQYVFKKSEIFG